MTTTLAAQLAEIRASTTNPLDLKTQKKAHSQSLLFEAHVAATQDFDTIYQICCEGFQELCKLDARFISFANNIFSEQSKQEDRTQMTITQNEQLDTALEEFIGLISSKLLLKPALKALEWLVRRFRVHETNTVFLTFTFLPYHMDPIFRTLLDILPQNVPRVLNFLHPYVQYRTNPPRHSIVSTASHNQAFFMGLNTYTLKVSRKKHNHPTLISFWSTVTTEAVAAMLDQSRSGRGEAQKQLQEDIILRVIPSLKEGLSLENVPDLRLGCYMVLTVLASKASLNDETLTAMMESTVTRWKSTTHAGLICLAVLAQQKQTALLPRKVFKALMAIEGLHDDLTILKGRYLVDNLVLGVLLGIVSRAEKASDTKSLSTFRSLIEAGLMNESLVAIATRYLLSAAQSFSLQANQDFDLQGSLGDLILRLADSATIGTVVQQVIKGSDVDIEHLETRLQRVIHSIEDRNDMLVEDVETKDVEERYPNETFGMVLSRIPTRTAYDISFLSHSDSYVFPSLAHGFSLASSSPHNIGTFLDLTVLRKSLAMTEPLFFSFFVRMWCGSYSTTARSTAITVISDFFKQERLVADVQILLPYIVYALADPSVRVRRATADLVLVLAAEYANFLSPAQQDTKPSLLGKDEIYGQGKEAKEVSWLTVTEAFKFLQDIIVPSLEECMLDALHILSYLPDSFMGSKHAKEMRTSLRAAIFSCLCSHVVNTPLYSVKYRLLQILNRVTKIGSVSRTKVLLPLLEKSTMQSQNDFQVLCENQGIIPEQLVEQIVNVVTPSDREGVQIVKAIIQSDNQSTSPLFYPAVLKHVQNIWQSLKADNQSSIAKTLLNIAVDGAAGEQGGWQQREATETLRHLDLATNVLQSFLEELPPVSNPSGDQPSASKRRRTSHGRAVGSVASDLKALEQNYRRIAFVLELIEASKPERNASLIGGLFQLIADLQHSKHSTGRELSYLQVLALKNTLSILDAPRSSSKQRVDRSAIRADVLIDCIKTTPSPQVQHTALLLVSSLASVAPDLILHSVMPVFTHMGAQVLRQNNEFSAFVVKQTMESVIPRLVQSLREGKGDLLIGVSELLHSFVAAYQHMPAQQRLRLFKLLAEKLGADDFLFALLVLLKDKYSSGKSATRFAVELAGNHGPKTQFLTIEKYLDVALDILKPKPTSSSCLVTIDKDHNPESILANLLSLPSMILSDENLVSRTVKVLNEEKEEADIIRATYGRLLEQILALTQKTKHNKKLGTLCEQLLHALLRLFPISEFIGILRILLHRTDEGIQQQVLHSFERRLNDTRSDQSRSYEAILAFLPQLASLVEESSDLPLKHTAMACIDEILEKFGKKDTIMVTTIAITIAGPACLGVEDSKSRVMALLCLATMVEILRDAFIPIIPQSLPQAIEFLAASIGADTEDRRLHDAAYSFISNLLLYVPWMITAPSLDRVLTVSHESANAEMGEDCDRNRVDTLNLLAKQIEPKELFGALDRTWTSAITEGPKAVEEHLHVLRSSIHQRPKSSISKHSSSLACFFLKAFDSRRIQFSPRTEDSYKDHEVGEVEEAVNETAMAMIYKLNDTAFRPLFVRMMEWSTALKDEKKELQRKITWWTFLGKFFGTLKSIVTSYVSYIIEDAVEVLNTGSRKDSDSRLLWQRVVATLQKCFEHDHDEFWQSPNHFASISTALLASFPIACQSIPSSPQETPSLQTLLIEAITALAAATADAPVHHKFLNTQLLKHMSHDSVAVRLTAVRCERALTSRLGEEWLGTLPEMLPIIAEGLEDDDASMEAEVRRWVSEIEEVLGEKLDDMLK